MITQNRCGSQIDEGVFMDSITRRRRYRFVDTAVLYLSIDATKGINEVPSITATSLTPLLT